MSKKSNVYQKLSKMKKQQLVQLVRDNNLVININSKKEDLVNHLFYYMNKRSNSYNYKIPKIHDVKPYNGQIYHEIGLRPTMEDTHLCVKLDDVYLTAIFDGHGGNDASDNLPGLVSKYILEPFKDVNLRYNSHKVIDHIKTAFRKIDDEIISIVGDESGSTCTMVLDIGDTIYSINLGDSRNVIYKYNTNNLSKPVMVFVSRDHKPDDPLEYERINNLGGFVEQEEDDDPRLNGSLATSRAFGDEYLKTNNTEFFKGPLSIEPDIKIIKKKDNYKYFAIIACDGLWDVMDSNVAIQYIHKFGMDEGAKNLVKIALYKNSSDNISVINTQLF